MSNFKVLLSDFSQVILFPKDLSYQGSLNDLFKAEGHSVSFFHLYTVNQELLDFYQQLKDKHGLRIVMFTTGTVQNNPEVQPLLTPVFEKIFTAATLPYTKKEAAAYTLIAQELGVDPAEVVFIDDSMSNIFAAREAGLTALQFRSTSQAKAEILTTFGLDDLSRKD